MKKLLLLLLAAFMIFSLVACSSGNTSEEPDVSSEKEEPSDNSVELPSEPAETEDEDVEEGNEPEAETLSPEIFETINYSGSGDSVLEIDEPDGMYVFQISGNASGNHFAVKSYDENGEPLDLLVNTTDVYNGTTLGSSNGVKLLEISSNGEWSIDLVSIYNMPSLSAGETYTGADDAVVQINTDGLTTEISGNENERHFAVKAYDYDWNYINLLVNTTDIYSGTVMLRNSPDLLVINANGPWSITLG